MDMSASQCTSASESGWTLYLQDHPTSLSPPQNHQKSAKKMSCGGSEEELSMSMVSDASSGPPIHHQRSSSGSSRKRKKASCLDDTASSTLKKFTTFANMKPSMSHVSSQGFSTTEFKGTFALQKHFGFFKSETPDSQGFGGCRRRK